MAVSKRVSRDPDEKLKARRSAVSIARFALEHCEDLHPKHVTELLRLACWKYTEALDKYRVRYMTRAAMQPNADRQHEHVIPQRVLARAMREQPSLVEQILSLSIACIVTRQEHLRLIDGFGWERYRDVDLHVIDTETGAPADVESLARSLLVDWQRLTHLDVGETHERVEAKRRSSVRNVL